MLHSNLTILVLLISVLDLSHALSVAVVGGSGFVGSRVCQSLVSKGATITSLSKSGSTPKWAQDEPWTKEVTWKSVDVLTASEDELAQCMGKPEAVISCVGAIGTDPDVLLKGNGDANVNVFECAQKAGSVRVVAYVSVSSEVAACRDGWLPQFFGAYFDGKNKAEEAAKSVCNSVTIVRPTFIYGGDSFGLNPPRVNTAYGSFIDQLLSFGLIQIVADVMPGLIKVALRAPVAVESVANACVEGVVNPKEGVTILDTAKDINEASGQPPATGVEDAVKWTLKTAKQFAEWVEKKTGELEGANAAKK